MQANDEQSLKEIAIPMNFINLGSAETIPWAVIADKLAALTPLGTYASVEDAVHLSFLPECKDGAAELLKSWERSIQSARTAAAARAQISIPS